MARIYDRSDVSAKAMKQVGEMINGEGLKDFGLVNLDRLNTEMMQKIKEDNPKFILGYGFLTKSHWVNNGKIDEFLQWIIEGRALFLRQPVAIGDLILRCHDLVDGKLDNSEMIGQVYMKKNKSLVGTLLHDLQPNKCRDIKDEALKRAEAELGIVGADVEVVQKLKQVAEKLNVEEMSNEVVSGVFCDIEGTLWVDEKLNEEVVKKLREFEQSGKVITVWTGGDVEEYQQLLKELGLNWSVVSKYSFSGKRVEIAIDDLDKTEFIKLYGIVPEKFIKIEGR